MRILLAEDDINISTITKMTLESLGGHDVSLAKDGAEAFEKASHGIFDLIILDEMMPKMNGLKVCEKLIEQSDFSTPIIFLSAQSQKTDTDQFIKLAQGYISKPFDPLTLNSQIQEILGIAA